MSIYDDNRARLRVLRQNRRRDGAVLALDETAPAEPTSATLHLYDVIGGFCGLDAAAMVEQIDALDVDEIRMYINSPGGDVYDAIAITNALRRNRARVVSVVDGLAASAASFIAQAGDEVVMGRNSEMMVHDAWGLCVGNAQDMRELADDLDRVSDNIASMYAERSGTSATAWRDVMRSEAWYSADEAVAAGLADRVDEAPEDEADDAADGLAARYDLSIFNHKGRRDAPAPPLPNRDYWYDRGAQILPAASAAGSTKTHERSLAVAFSDEQITDMRQQLGVAEDADEATILAALSEALTEQAAPENAAPAVPDGMAVVDAEVLAQLRADAEAGRQARTTQLEAERDGAIDAAVRDGRIMRSRAEHWRESWNADPDGARQLLASLAPGLVPVDELGVGESPAETEDDALYASVFGDEKKGA